MRWGYRIVALACLLSCSPALAEGFQGRLDAFQPAKSRTTIEPNAAGGVTVYKGAISEGQVRPNGLGGYTYEKKSPTPTYFPKMKPDKRR